MKKPLIGITAMYSAEGDIHATRSTYINAIRDAGGEVILLPTGKDISMCSHLIDCIDGLLIPGGPDISPLLYNEEPIPQMGMARMYEDKFEIELIKLAAQFNKPMLAICRGLQIVNVAFGGTLYQDIPFQCSSKIAHKQAANIRDEGTHTVTFTPESKISAIMNTTSIATNSYHHQAIKDLADGFIVTGKSADGIIESIESLSGDIIAAQWHPECMTHIPEFKNLFIDFIKKCNK